MYVTITQGAPDAHVAVSGSLNTSTAPELEGVLEPLFGEAQSIVFDFSELDYISSAGLRVLMVAYKRLGAQAITIEHTSDEVREVFDVTGFSGLLEIR